MKEKITIPFYNDLLFKYFVYDNEDEGCQYILKKIIEEITPIRCKELYVINSELMAHHYREKRSILDVRVKTQEGEYINIEVQSAGLFESLHRRFQYYAFKNIALQIKSGDEYRKLQPVYQIILYHEEDKEYHELIRKFSIMDNKYHDDKGSLIHIYYVFLKEIESIKKINVETQMSSGSVNEITIYPLYEMFYDEKEIEKIVKEKGKDHLNELEELCYVIEKGNECDRIKMTRVGQIMKEKYDKFMEDMNLREEAWAYEKAEFDKIAHYVDGEAKGKVEGRAEGKKEKSKSHVIKFYKMKYPNEDISWLENLTEKQYDEIFDMLLNNEDLEVIKRIIGK